MEYVSIILEIINEVLCLKILFFKKMQLDFKIIILIIIDLMIFKAVSLYGLKNVFQLIMYPVIIIYCMIEFKTSFFKAVLNFILSIIMISTIQLGIGFLFLILNISFLSENNFSLAIQIITFFICWFMKKILEDISKLMEESKILSKIVLFVSFLKVMFVLTRYKRNMELSIEELVTILFGGLLLGSVLYYWQKEKMKVEMKEMELQMSKMYYESFEELISTIRKNQHDFHNHLQAIYSLHYSIRDYDTLVAEQEKYAKFISKSSKFYKLLSVQSPIITGFLYRKFVEADEEGYDISYHIKLENSQDSIPEYILIEIIGILWDNAVESGRELENKKVSLRIEDTQERFEIEVSNPIVDIPYTKIHSFFEEDNTTKGKFRGVGLSKIKEYKKKYHFDLIVRKMEIEDEYWLCIKICFPLSKRMSMKKVS